VSLGVAVSLVGHAQQSDDPMLHFAVAGGLILIVFLTYFLLGLTGFKASPRGSVNVPRVYAWSLVCAIVVLVFGALFYFLHTR
jgi:hypothetical protein